MANSIDLVMRLLADDKASPAFRKAGAAVDETGGKYAKFAKTAAGALAAVGVVKFAKDSVKAYADAEQSQAKLELAYKKFPKTANLSIASLRAYNSELQKKTKYDDDDTAAMQAHLAMFNLTGKQIKELTPLVQDLASAQGVDLATASDAVGKALMGNTRGLKAIGVEFKATGDTAKDYAAIQALLNKQVGGFAENEGKTAAGQAAILANQWGDLQETVGGALVPALTSLVNVAKPILETFNGMPEPIKQTTIVVGALGAGFVLLAPKIAAAKALMADFTASKGVGGAAAASGRLSGVLGKVGAIAGAAGPWGLAIGAGITALGLFASGSDDAAEAQTQFKQALEGSNGALDENVRKTVAKKAEDDGLLAQARKLGIAEADVVDAILGDAAARQKVTEATQGVITANQKAAAGSVRGQSAFTAQALAAQALRDKIGDLSGALNTAATSQGRINAALDNTDAKAKAVATSWAALRTALKQPINGSIRISVRANGDVAVSSGSGGGRAVVPRNAAGGEAPAGQARWVGEFGPELFTPPTSGRIVPNSVARSASSTAGTAQVNVYLDGKQVQTSLVTLKRRQGGSLAFEQ